MPLMRIITSFSWRNLLKSWRECRGCAAYWCQNILSSFLCYHLLFTTILTMSYYYYHQNLIQSLSNYSSRQRTQTNRLDTHQRFLYRRRSWCFSGAWPTKTLSGRHQTSLACLSHQLTNPSLKCLASSTLSHPHSSAGLHPVRRRQDQQFWAECVV